MMKYLRKNKNKQIQSNIWPATRVYLALHMFPSGMRFKCPFIFETMTRASSAALYETAKGAMPSLTMFFVFITPVKLHPSSLTMNYLTGILSCFLQADTMRRNSVTPNVCFSTKTHSTISNTAAERFLVSSNIVIVPSLFLGEEFGFFMAIGMWTLAWIIPRTNTIYQDCLWATMILTRLMLSVRGSFSMNLIMIVVYRFGGSENYGSRWVCHLRRLHCHSVAHMGTVRCGSEGIGTWVWVVRYGYPRSACWAGVVSLQIRVGFVLWVFYSCFIWWT